jgi:hypothetical protein
MSVRPFADEFEGNKYVSLQLKNVQWVKDDERLDGRIAASDEFDATEDMPVGMDMAGSGGQRGGDAAELAALLGAS